MANFGGFTAASRGLVTLPDGRRAFAKGATNDLTESWLRAEHHVYTHLQGSFTPRLRLGSQNRASKAGCPRMVGFFARAGLPVIPDAPRVRAIQLAQLEVVLAWACRPLGIDGPDGNSVFRGGV